MSQFNYKKIKTEKPVTPWQDVEYSSESEEDSMDVDVEGLVERFEDCLNRLEKLIQESKQNTTPSLSMEPIFPSQEQELFKHPFVSPYKGQQ